MFNGNPNPLQNVLPHSRYTPKNPTPHGVGFFCAFDKFDFLASTNNEDERTLGECFILR